MTVNCLSVRFIRANEAESFKCSPCSAQVVLLKPDYIISCSHSVLNGLLLSGSLAQPRFTFQILHFSPFDKPIFSLNRRDGLYICKLS